MYKKLVLFFLSLVSFCLLAPISSAFAADQVQASLPSFTVTLNGQTTGNDYSKYPLIVYKNITYFPMTYYDCRLLGLKTDWTNDTGLMIEKNEDYFYEYMREVNDNKNASKQIAKIAADKITVNGKVVDNSTEEYPLLVFRDVTYFPLTWRFAVNEFGWNYTFDQKNGLVIQNNNVKLENPEDSLWETLYPGSITGSGAGFFMIQSKFENIKIDRTTVQTTTDHALQPGKISFMYLSAANKNFQGLSLSYQIYKVIGDTEELVYQKIVPPFKGLIESESVQSIKVPISYWQSSTLQKGKYRLRIGFPKDITYYYDTNEQLQSLNLTKEFSSPTAPEISSCLVEIK